MEPKKNNGGPAFPVLELDQISGQIYDQHMGVTVRDYFAAQALPGVLGAVMPQECHRWSLADFAHEAYALADAMLAERAKPAGGA
jgi:hypothetical protein